MPTNGFYGPLGLAVDSAGDLFIVDLDSNAVEELPRTETGFGPPIALLTTGLPVAA